MLGSKSTSGEFPRCRRWQWLRDRICMVLSIASRKSFGVSRVTTPRNLHLHVILKLVESESSLRKSRVMYLLNLQVPQVPTMSTRPRTDEGPQPPTVPDKQRLGPDPSFTLHPLNCLPSCNMTVCTPTNAENSAQTTFSAKRLPTVIIVSQPKLLFMWRLRIWGSTRFRVWILDNVCQPPNALVIVEQA